MEFQTKVAVDSSKLPEFKQLLDEWLNVQQRYCERVPPENPWLYSERPCIGLLAAAATLVGAVTLEEWRTKKSREEGEGYGRNDLWLRFNSPPNQSDYAIEAKYESIEFAKELLPNIKQKIEDILRIAVEDASSVPKHVGCPAGIAFISLRQYNEQDVSNAPKQIFNLVESGIEFDAFAGICLSSQSFEKSKAEAQKDGWKNDTFGMIVLIRLGKKNDDPRQNR